MKITINLLAIIALLAMPLSAEKQGKPAGERAAAGACKADVDKFCGAHKGNRKAMKDCIQANTDKFSAECKANKAGRKAHKAERKAKFQKTMEVCQKDIEQFCAADRAKKPMAMRCLMKNREKITPECRATLPEKRVRKEK